MVNVLPLLSLALPTLHLLLGDLYTRTGLPNLAAESFDEAQFLMKK